MNAGTVACAPSGLRWQTIKWVKLRRQVRKLQARIVKATQDGKYGKVKSFAMAVDPFVQRQSISRETSD